MKLNGYIENLLLLIFTCVLFLAAITLIFNIGISFNEKLLTSIFLKVKCEEVKK